MKHIYAERQLCGAINFIKKVIKATFHYINSEIIFFFVSQTNNLFNNKFKMKTKTIIIIIVAAIVIVGAGVVIKKRVIDPKTELKHSRKVIEELQATTPLMDGDIIFQNTKAPYGDYIKRTTDSEYTHCGIILTEDGITYVYEAAEPGSKTPLDKWITNGKDGSFVIKRLKADSLITAKKIVKLKKEIEKVIGKEYDYTFEWADNKAYSSEMVWKAYIRGLTVKLSELQSLKNFDITAPDINKRFKERYTLIDIPYWELTVSPQDIYESDKLRTVAKK